MDVYVLSSINHTKGEIPIAIGTNFAEAIKDICSFTRPIIYFNRYIFKIGKEMFMVRKMQIEESPNIVVISKLNRDDGTQSIFGIASSESKAYKFIKKFINISSITTDDIDGTRTVVGNTSELSINDNDTKDVYFVRTFAI